MDLKLITDRTSADVEYAKSYQGKKWEDLSAEQKKEEIFFLFLFFLHSVVLRQ